MCDHVRNSHDHSVLQSIDITRRNLMLITLGLKGLKERGVYSHNCNKLNKTNMLSAKISKEFKNSGISAPSIIDNPLVGLLCCHR